ncbi:GreA/GreB family elongation factor [Dehalogenimonas sp. THU2]|uniref:GreA/GreB family elongation factor n=1 Tax=Dehalogenimonas sp. THU2 TaxID=3151121 RepID=UPI003218A57E
MSPENTNKPLTLTEAAVAYLASLSAAKRQVMTPAVMNFVRWYGGNHTLNNLSAPKLADYAAAQPAGEEAAAKLKAVKEMLSYSVKNGWIEASLGAHVKLKKSPLRSVSAARKPAKVEQLVLTTAKKAEMDNELAALKEKRFHVVEDIKRAAADKDLKENAPYHAAREEKAKLDGKVEELALLLKHAIVNDDETRAGGTKAELGRKITIKDVATGSTSTYTLVIPREVSPKSGRISPVSPIGKAVSGRAVGDTVDVIAPSCVVRYIIESIE